MTWYQATSTVLTAWNLVWSLLFVADYHRLSRGLWWHNEYGKMLMALPASLALLFGFIFVSRLLGDSLIRQVIGLVLYAGFSVCLPWLHRLMRLSMRRRSKVDAPKGGASDGT